MLRYLSPLEVLGCLLAGAMHDVRHPGVNNKYLTATVSEVALTYNDKVRWVLVQSSLCS
jgi:hypothetical protein